MYNPQLETFIRVADAGSFNKAAEEAYITPTAVIKQINLLEAELDVKLFETWGNQWLPDRYFVENILLFLPFGVLLPAAVPSLRKGWCCVYAAFSTSMMLETVQLLTERGYCQLDDVVTNTLGAAIGYLVFALVRKCWRGKIEE